MATQSTRNGPNKLPCITTRLLSTRSPPKRTLVDPLLCDSLPGLLVDATQAPRHRDRFSQLSRSGDIKERIAYEDAPRMDAWKAASRSNSWPGLRLSLTPGPYWELGPSVTGAYKPSEQSAAVSLLLVGFVYWTMFVSAEEKEKDAWIYSKLGGTRSLYSVFRTRVWKNWKQPIRGVWRDDHGIT